MPLRSRSVLAVLLALVVPAALAGCGGAGTRDASSGADARDLLADTFSASRAARSGTLRLHLVEGRSALTVSGPFAARGRGRLPRLALAARLAAPGAVERGGLTLTGDGAFVRLHGTEYAVGRELLTAFEDGYAEGRAQALGIDPRRWLTNPRTAGETRFDGQRALRITGDVDGARLLDDLDAVLATVRSLGLPGAGGVGARETVGTPRAEVVTGAEDHVLRRLAVDLRVRDGAGATKPLRLDVGLAAINERQRIAAPRRARPLAELLGGLGALAGPAGVGSAP